MILGTFSGTRGPARLSHGATSTSSSCRDPWKPFSLPVRTSSWPVRRLRAASIATMATADVARRVLDALANAFPARRAAAALEASAEAPLRFLPDDLEAVKATCKAFAGAAFDLKA